MKKKIARMIEGGNIKNLRKLFGENLDPKKSILDVGCGRHLSFNYSKKFSKIVAVDNNDKHLSYLRKRGHEITIKKANAAKLPFKRNCFDQVVLSGVIQYVKGYEKVLRECYRVLKPKGTFLIATINGDSLLRRLGIIDRRAKKHAGEYKIFSAREIARLLNENGFAAISFKGADLIKMPRELCTNIFFKARKNRK